MNVVGWNRVEISTSEAAAAHLLVWAYADEFCKAKARADNRAAVFWNRHLIKQSRDVALLDFNGYHCNYCQGRVDSGAGQCPGCHSRDFRISEIEAIQ